MDPSRRLRFPEAAHETRSSGRKGSLVNVSSPASRFPRLLSKKSRKPIL